MKEKAEESLGGNKKATWRFGTPGPKRSVALTELQRHLRDDEAGLRSAEEAGELRRLIDQVKRDHPHLWDD